MSHTVNAPEELKPTERQEIEGLLIGWMLSNPQSFCAIDGLNADLFSEGLPREAARAMAGRLDRGDLINPATIAADLGVHASGALDYLKACMQASITVLMPEDYVAWLQEGNRRTRLDEVCVQISQSAKSVEEMASGIMDAVENVMRDTHSSRMMNAYEVGQQILDNLKAPAVIYSTGLPKLDDCMGGGLYPGKSYGFAARKKVGKTTMAGTISCNLAQRGIKHLFVCGEMSAAEIHQRTLCRLSQTYPSHFRTNEGRQEWFQRKIADAITRHSAATIYLNAPGLTFTELRRSLMTAILRHKIKGFILDYWQLVGGKEARKSTAEHLDEVAQWIADFSRKHGLWAIVMAQVNQTGNTRGGEGIRLAFDQVYELKHLPSDNDEDAEPDPGDDRRWLEMIETRYTKWQHVGSEGKPGYVMNDKGPYFDEEP